MLGRSCINGLIIEWVSALNDTVGWIRRRISSLWIQDGYWNRNTRWSALLQSQRQFQRTLAKERSRVDRDGECFGLLILKFRRPQNNKHQSRRLAKLIHRRLRDTDEKGHLSRDSIGVMLPATDAVGCERVLAELLELATKSRLDIHGEWFVYPDWPAPPLYGLLWEKDIATRSMARSRSSSLSVMIPPYPRWKRVIDIALATTALFISLPLLLILILLIRMTNQGPAIFRQRRAGFLGRPFTIYKLRTMIAGAEELQLGLRERNERDGPAFKLIDDPRITPMGRFLRCTGIDELPQLINVLRGDMAVVGPRPLPLDEAVQCLPWQQRRLEVKPGLTCLWQVSKDRQISFADWMRLDLRYVNCTSLWLDMKLILKTCRAVLLGRVGH